MQVWAEALDAWLQQLAQEIVHEHTSQALTPENVQASLQALLRKEELMSQQFVWAQSCLWGCWLHGVAVVKCNLPVTGMLSFRGAVD
ncbi:hypothetical protein ABBQ32_003565 [Trebouxia sp. C0010 RCD-2024]